jgi:APA family basic amino acid/polyamine antiporter
MVGSGILTTSGYVVESLQSYGLLMLFWVIGGVISLLGSLALAEMATAYPRVGGDYNFVRIGFGNRWAFVYGWATVIVGYAAPVSLISYTVANFVSPYFHFSGSPRLLNQLLASAIIVVFTVSHCLGHRQSSFVQSASTLFKLAVFLGVLLGVFWSDAISWRNLADGFIPSGSSSGYGTSMIYVMYAYTGWSAAVYLAGEMHDPQKSVPFALVVGTLTVTAIYLLLNVFYAMALPIESLISASSDDKARVALLAIEAAYGSNATKVFSVMLSLGMLASVSALILAGPRILYAMARDKLLFGRLGELHPTRNVPAIAVICQGLISIFLLWVGIFEEILEMTGFGLGVMSLLSVGVLFKLRQLPTYKPTMRTPGYPIFPIVFCLINIWMLVDAAYHGPLSAVISIAILCIGFPLYHLQSRSV